MLLQAVLLVCSISTAHCDENTALKVALGPTVSSVKLCKFHAEVLRAQNVAEDGTVVTTTCAAVSQVTASTGVQTPLTITKADYLSN